MSVKCGRHLADCADVNCPTHGSPSGDSEPKVLYVYGTLRPGKAKTVDIPGRLFDLGWYPGAILIPRDTHSIVCERIEVNDWKAVDAYEGYDPSNPEESLYIRRPMLDGFIYEYNRAINPNKMVASGDWLDYTQTDRGTNGNIFQEG